MMVRGLREMSWVAAVAGTALGCYMVSLKVASERAALDDVTDRIVLAQREIRVLQTEIGTRGRLEQLESWNVKVLALSAPQAQQFLEGEFQLATLTAPRKTVDPAAPVVLASAPVPAPRAATTDDEPAAGKSAKDLMQVASLRRDIPERAEKTVDKPAVAATGTVKAALKPASAPTPATKAPAKAATAAGTRAKAEATGKDKAAAITTTKSAATAKTTATATAKAKTKSPSTPTSKDAKTRQ